MNVIEYQIVALQAFVDDIYNKIEEQNRRILSLGQELKALKGVK